VSEVWWCDFTYAGKRIHESTDQKLKTLAVEYEEQRRRELERAVAGLPVEPARKRIQTVDEMLKSYRENYAVNHDREKSRLSYRTEAHTSSDCSATCWFPR